MSGAPSRASTKSGALLARHYPPLPGGRDEDEFAELACRIVTGTRRRMSMEEREMVQVRHGSFPARAAASGCWQHSARWPVAAYLRRTRNRRRRSNRQEPQYAAPLATHTFPYDPETGVVGTLQTTISRHEDTLSDIARRFNLGYDEVVNANPGVDPWLPGAGRRIVLPTQFVLPDAPHEGLVVNLAALRLYYFPKAKKDEPRQGHHLSDRHRHGRLGNADRHDEDRLQAQGPVWTPPASVRKEHAAEGDILPARVPPGPDNPLGCLCDEPRLAQLPDARHEQAGGRRHARSHGCIRLYPEDIATIFETIPVGTKVTVVNQPLVYRAQGGTFYVQSYPPHEEHPRPSRRPRGSASTRKLQDKMFQRAKQDGVIVDWALTEKVVNDARGVAVPVSGTGVDYDTFVASSLLVENAIPEGSTWDGTDRPVPVRGDPAPPPVTAVAGRQPVTSCADSRAAVTSSPPPR
jgi:L,D-transpeptidase ErfK/SrfK